jgi:Fe-S-cluster-containing dehydrogenase component
MDAKRKGLPVVQSPQPPAPADGADALSDQGRRAFLSNILKLSGGAVVFVAGATAAEAASEVARPAQGKDAPRESYHWDEHLYAYLIDTEKCIGCGSCVRACAAENKVPDGFFRTWIERYVMGLEGTHVDSPNGGKEGFGPVHVSFTATKSFFVPKMCNHCKATPCTQVCPVGASYRTKDGVVLVDSKSCIGCAYCVQACPYGSRFISPLTHTAEKCTWCYHRITKGLKPACVEVCPTGTRLFGDLKREGDPVRHAIERDRVSVLQAHLLTEPQCYYKHLDKEVR